MSCPACGGELVPVSAGELTVDACSGGCAGIWFDPHELAKLDEAHERVGETLLDVRAADPLPARADPPLDCPRCDGVVRMTHHFTSVERGVEVDECPGCGGFWLDAGELRALRGEFATEAERDRAADAYFSEVFDGEMAAEHAKTEAELASAQKFARTFRFITPSWYLPGDQKGGAF